MGTLPQIEALSKEGVALLDAAKEKLVADLDKCAQLCLWIQQHATVERTTLLVDTAACNRGAHHVTLLAGRIKMEVDMFSYTRVQKLTEISEQMKVLPMCAHCLWPHMLHVKACS